MQVKALVKKSGRGKQNFRNIMTPALCLSINKIVFNNFEWTPKSHCLQAWNIMYVNAENTRNTAATISQFFSGPLFCCIQCSHFLLTRLKRFYWLLGKWPRRASSLNSLWIDLSLRSCYQLSAKIRIGSTVLFHGGEYFKVYLLGFFGFWIKVYWIGFCSF